MIKRPRGSSGTRLVPTAEGQGAGPPGPGPTSRLRRPRARVPAPRTAEHAAVGGPRRQRAVTGRSAAPTLTLHRLGSRARPPQPAGGLPRPQRGKQPPALLATLLSCSHLCARAPPPPPPEGRRRPPPPPRVCQVLGSRRGRARRRSLCPRRAGKRGEGAGRSGGNSCWGGARGVRPGPGVGATALR